MVSSQLAAPSRSILGKNQTLLIDVIDTVDGHIQVKCSSDWDRFNIGISLIAGRMFDHWGAEWLFFRLIWTRDSIDGEEKIAFGKKIEFNYCCFTRNLVAPFIIVRLPWEGRSENTVGSQQRKSKFRNVRFDRELISNCYADL